MTSFIEESMIINHLTSPQNFNNPKEQSLALNSQQQYVSISHSNNNSLLNPHDVENSKIVDDNSFNEIVNPMSSLSDLQSQHQNKVDSDLELKQVLTEVNDSDGFYQENLKESLKNIQETQIQQNKHLISISELQQQQIEKHKQIILKKNLHLSFANSICSQINQNLQQTSSPTNPIYAFEIRQQYSNLDQDQLQNFKEIYKFYSKLPITTNKYQTFEQLSQLSNTMILQKFMIFCKDFKLIDLEISNDLIQLLGGKINNSPKKQINYNYKNNNNKSNFIITKFYLVQIYKQNADKNMELNFQNFIILIQRLANQLFPLQNYLLYEFLNLKNPKLYRKKMTLVGKPFNSREQSEIITQEKLYERKKILPPTTKGKSESSRKQEDTSSIQFPKISRRINTYKCYSPCEDKHKQEDNHSIQLEDFLDQKHDYDQKKIYFEQQFNDKEDEFNPQDYFYCNPRSNRNKKISDHLNFSRNNKIQQISHYNNIVDSYHKYDRLSTNSRNQIEISQIMVASGNTRPSNFKSCENQENITKKSPSYSPQCRELCNLEKKYKIKKALANQQSYREKYVKKTKF